MRRTLALSLLLAACGARTELRGKVQTCTGTCSSLVLFGGYAAGEVLGDTWTWDGSTWSPSISSPSPAARQDAAMASGAAGVVLFGGQGAPGPTYPDTWTWQASGWSQPALASSPPARVWTAMASSAAGVVLFGGQSDSGLAPLADTWTWDGSWSQAMPSASPPPRSLHAMARWGSGVVVFGGVTTGQARLDDTWVWDGTTWSQSTSSVRPHAREQAAMASLGGKVVLFGGYSYDPTSGNLWLNDTDVGRRELGARAPCLVAVRAQPARHGELQRRGRALRRRRRERRRARRHVDVGRRGVDGAAPGGRAIASRRSCDGGRALTPWGDVDRARWLSSDPGRTPRRHFPVVFEGVKSAPSLQHDPTMVPSPFDPAVDYACSYGDDAVTMRLSSLELDVFAPASEEALSTTVVDPFRLPTGSGGRCDHAFVLSLPSSIADRLGAPPPEWTKPTPWVAPEWGVRSERQRSRAEFVATEVLGGAGMKLLMVLANVIVVGTLTTVGATEISHGIGATDPVGIAMRSPKALQHSVRSRDRIAGFSPRVNAVTVSIDSLARTRRRF